MSHEVYANGMEIAAKAGQNKSIARFPDVCLSPPSPPAGPIPVPYADTSFSSDLKEGSDTVTLGGQPAALAQQSYYQPSALGDEAATRTFGMNVVTHQITGKTYFQAWSMDVVIEGKNVCRHLDITTSNHASDPPGTPPNVTTEAQTRALIEEGNCPCCGGPLHENQKDDAGNALETIRQDDYYAGKRDAVIKKIAGFAKWAEDNPDKVDQLMPRPLTFGSPVYPEVPATYRESARLEEERAREIYSRLKALEDADCPNLHKPRDVGCGTHFKTPTDKRSVAGRKGKKTPGQWARDEFTPGVRNNALAAARSKFPDKVIPDEDQVNHMTPLDAGGCPKSMDNMIPDGALSEECLTIDRLQGALQGRS
jgi:hypothetical protein